MAAYNRVTRRWVDGFGLTANDFNAMMDDIKFSYLKEISAILAGNTVIPGGGTAAFSDGNYAQFSDGSNLTFSG